MVQHYNLESSSFESPEGQHPPQLLPYLPEIRAFAEHTYYHVVYRILKLISLALELPEDYLWGLHDQTGAIGAACQRFMGYFPRSAEDEKATEGIWSKGHTDCESFLSLQIDGALTDVSQIIASRSCIPNPSRLFRY